MIHLCKLADLPEGEARGFVLPTTQVVALRDRGGVHVYLNRCPHLGIRLQWHGHDFLDSEGMYIRCATHGALFEKDTGLCVQGPCRGENLWKIECSVENGIVVIDEHELPAAPSIIV